MLKKLVFKSKISAFAKAFLEMTGVSANASAFWNSLI